ncbi:NAD+ synthase [Gemmatimonas aurantiaca]|nr:NAD+ synthase [Gemmatimonas aurantiaca]
MMKITLAQINPLVGDVEGATGKVLSAFRDAPPDSDLVVFPEMCLVGYPALDLLERPRVLARVEAALARLAVASKERSQCGMIVGAPMKNTTAGQRNLYNCAVLIADGEIKSVHRKALLPTYDVFDEERYFQPADSVSVVQYKGETLGISVCEDAWTDPALWPRGVIYDRDPLAELAALGATLMINISASPYSLGRERVRLDLFAEHARRHKTPVVVVNQVGGNDELIFDGTSFALDANGAPLAVLQSFAEDYVTTDMAEVGDATRFVESDDTTAMYRALVYGLQDYARKCGFGKAVVGVSGGLDSAVTLAIAVAALGPENVLSLAMPSEYSSAGSVTDSQALCENLSIDLKILPIAETYQSYLRTLEEHISSADIGVTQENLQARIRGNLLMAFSNEFGYLTLATGNKSELAVGYCTLYGDMSGGLCVLADTPKTKVYDLARHINRERKIIPQEIIDKAPSAELRPDQKDQDTLPPYAILDAILQAYIEDGLSVEEIVAKGFDSETVNWVIRAVNNNEYKRRQAAPGLRVTSKSFGMGRRMTIAAKPEQ